MNPSADSDATTSVRRAGPSERRTKAIDAFLDLVLEHGTPPRPEAVAERAGVSLATLYRYFATLEELRHEAAARVLDRFPELFAVPDIGSGNRAQRIARFAAARLALHETLHPLELLVRSTTATDPAAAEFVDVARRALADQVRLHFDDELRPLTPARRDDTVAAIAALTSIESWDQFRHSQRRSSAQTRRAWVDAIDRLLPDH